MYRTALGVIAGKAKAFGVLTAVILAGGLAGGLLSSGGASGAVSPESSVQGTEQRVTPHPTGSPGTQGVHGRCVSKVARNHDAVGGPHHNHGGAVSAAAHSCPKGSGDSGG